MCVSVCVCMFVCMRVCVCVCVYVCVCDWANKFGYNIASKSNLNFLKMLFTFRRIWNQENTRTGTSSL